MMAVDPEVPPGPLVGARIKAIMQERHLSQGQVAASAHLSQPTVSALVSGSTQDPPLSTLLGIARALSLTLDQMVDLTPGAVADDPLVELRDEVARMARRQADEVATVRAEMQQLRSLLESAQGASPKRRVGRVGGG